MEQRLMGLPLVEPLRSAPRETTSADSQEQRPALLSKVQPLPPAQPKRHLFFDIETLAGGYADPSWVPDKITVAAASYLDSVEVDYRAVGKLDWWTREGRANVIAWLFGLLKQPNTIAIGHNIARFDLRTLNAEAMRCGIEPIMPGTVEIQDTMNFAPKTKGWKKGLDNVAKYVGVRDDKQAMNIAQWDFAYEQDGWTEAISRCCSDVHLNKLVFLELRKRGWLKPPRLWR